MRTKIAFVFKKLTSLLQLSSSPFFLYCAMGSFVLGWWLLAFYPLSIPPTFSVNTSQPLSLKTSTLLKELSPLQRDALQRALAGDFRVILQLIQQWDQDALYLNQQRVPGIQRLSSEAYLQAQVLEHILRHSSPSSLHQLNCKMNVDWIQDDSGCLLHIQDHFRRFLPQTHCAASFLLAIAHPTQIIALPRGLRQFTQLYSPSLLATIPVDVDRLSRDQLHLQQPDVAFIAPYSHPPFLDTLRQQKIPLFSLHSTNTIEEIQQALLKVGHASNHILEAQLLAIFIDACFISMDNRLRYLQEKITEPSTSRTFLYLSQHQQYALPTTKSLTGQLMTRALKYCSHLRGTIPENQEEWHLPFTHEHILQANPESMIISISSTFPLHPFLQHTQAFKAQQIFYIDDTIQESPTQYVALAYFDLFQALAATYL